ncbi:MAG: DnaD domain protein [Oscillospiraceae bacterium]|nr:DnaD domain protein [Oscillospiraceae bacterium]
MSYTVNMGLWRKIFAVPADTVSDEKLRMCGAAQLKILLYILREGEVDAEKISAALRMSAGDVNDGLDYWKNEGLICESGAVPVVQPQAMSQVQNKQQEEPLTEPKAVRELKPLTAPPTRLNAKELELLSKKPDISAMLKAAEAMLGKTFTSSDTSTLLWLTNWAGVPPEMILTVISYCIEIGKPRMSYIQATAIAWMNDGVETVEQAEKYLKEVHAVRSYEKLVCSVFGIYNRALTTAEKKVIAIWQDAGFEQPLLKAAYERTIDAIGKISFNYINKILLSWKEKGITTPEQAEAERTAAKENRKLEKSYDIREVEKIFADDLVNLDF